MAGQVLDFTMRSLTSSWCVQLQSRVPTDSGIDKRTVNRSSFSVAPLERFLSKGDHGVPLKVLTHVEKCLHDRRIKNTRLLLVTFTVKVAVDAKAFAVGICCAL